MSMEKTKEILAAAAKKGFDICSISDFNNFVKCFYNV